MYKAHVVLVRCKYHHLSLTEGELAIATDGDACRPEENYRCAFADLQRVPAYCCGIPTHALIQTLGANTGAQIWTRSDLDFAVEGETSFFFDDAHEEIDLIDVSMPRAFHLDTWFLGPDQGQGR